MALDTSSKNKLNQSESNQSEKVAHSIEDEYNLIVSSFKTYCKDYERREVKLIKNLFQEVDSNVFSIVEKKNFLFFKKNFRKFLKELEKSFKKIKKGEEANKGETLSNEDLKKLDFHNKKYIHQIEFRSPRLTIFFASDDSTILIEDLIRSIKNMLSEYDRKLLEKYEGKGLQVSIDEQIKSTRLSLSDRFSLLKKYNCSVHSFKFIFCSDKDNKKLNNDFSDFLLQIMSNIGYKDQFYNLIKNKEDLFFKEKERIEKLLNTVNNVTNNDVKAITSLLNSIQCIYEELKKEYTGNAKDPGVDSANIFKDISSKFGFFSASIDEKNPNKIKQTDKLNIKDIVKLRLICKKNDIWPSFEKINFKSINYKKIILYPFIFSTLLFSLYLILTQLDDFINLAPIKDNPLIKKLENLDIIYASIFCAVVFISITLSILFSSIYRMNSIIKESIDDQIDPFLKLKNSGLWEADHEYKIVEEEIKKIAEENKKIAEENKKIAEENKKIAEENNKTAANTDESDITTHREIYIFKVAESLLGEHDTKLKEFIKNNQNEKTNKKDDNDLMRSNNHQVIELDTEPNSNNIKTQDASSQIPN